MPAKAKIACTIDRILMERVEQLRARSGESRSALINRALARLVDEAGYKARRERYVAAYHEQPETTQDTRLARHLSKRALAALAWDESGEPT